MLLLTALPSLGLSNNPGNIVKSNVPWIGKVKCQGRFECFDTKHNGLRAMVKNLHTYITKHKLTTVSQIINRWAPPHENNTNDYIKSIQTICGIHGDDSIYFSHNRNNGSLMCTVKVMIMMEGSGIVYTDKEITEVITNVWT